ncbi:thioredoxin fold domain-containing protein [Paramagnetospirillum kuznetsovii]|nr:thioredoxin fold domain-containing protein [Paramagnetospirillum kuznetsovii]
MNIDRRAILAMGLGMLLPVPAFASPAAEMEALLSESPWVGDGEPSRRHVYVVFAPWCPVCKQLFQRTRSTRGGVQLRWIAGGNRDEHAINQNLTVVSNRSLEALARVFRQEPVGDLTKDGPAVLRLTQSEMAIKQMAKRINFVGYPTLIFADGQGELKSIAGVPADLDAVFAQVGAWGKTE